MTEETDPFIEVILSRSSYRVGDSVVGTIRLVSSSSSSSATSPSTTTSTPSQNSQSARENDSSSGAGNNLSPRDIFSDTYLFVAGWCRLDPRWHGSGGGGGGSIAEYIKCYESPAVHYNLQNRRGPINDADGSFVIDENCVCFWTTNVIQLLDLKERSIGKWEDVKPKPLGSISQRRRRQQPSNCENDEHNEGQNGGGGDDHQQLLDTSGKSNNKILNSNESNHRPLEEEQLAFTFRAELPLDLPHSINANSCRYFYAVMVGTRVRPTSTSSSSRKKQWLRHGTPIKVLSCRPDQALPPPISDPEQPSMNKLFSMGSCTAMAHSVGLPIHVTATDLHQPTGQMLVNRRGNASLGALVVNNISRINPEAASVVSGNIQTMRITDSHGTPCCVLTVMGVSTASPGSRMILKFDFPIPQQKQKQQRQKRNNSNDDTTNWTPCYQVSASLEGQEVAVYTDGKTKRAQAYQFDTAHEMVDPECTERVCLSLKVPLDAPTTINADIVQINVHCIIDITVGTSSSSTSTQPINYSNLRLQLPCRIVHSLSEYELVLSGEELEEDEEDEHFKLPLDELILGSYRSCSSPSRPLWHDDNPPLVETEALRNTQDPLHPSSFITKDIQQDLKILSLCMANECGLIER